MYPGKWVHAPNFIFLDEVFPRVVPEYTAHEHPDQLAAGCILTVLAFPAQFHSKLVDDDSQANKQRGDVAVVLVGQLFQVLRCNLFVDFDDIQQIQEWVECQEQERHKGEDFQGLRGSDSAVRVLKRAAYALIHGY